MFYSENKLFAVDVTDLQAVTVVSAKGRLDSNTAGLFEQRVAAQLDAGIAKIVLDFDALDYISSAGLRVVLRAAKRQKMTQGQLVLCGLNKHIHEVFEISGFLPIFTISKKVDDAVRAINGG
ncbi:MAG: STAS domain-containing protein [bacterium]